MIPQIAISIAVLSLCLSVTSSWLSYLNLNYPDRPKMWRRPKEQP